MHLQCGNPCIECEPSIGGGRGPVDPANPFINLSSEAPDVDAFIGRRYTPPGDQPPLGDVFFAIGCLGWCISTISQEDANICAANQNVFCLGNNWPQPPVVPPVTPPDGNPPVTPPPTPRPIFFNNAQSCPFQCPDGTEFVFTVPAGTFASLFNQATVDQMAYSYACNQAVIQRLCLGTLSPAITCSENLYEGSVSASSVNVPITFTTSTPLPPGINMTQSPDTAFFSGIPTLPGDYLIALVATDSAGHEVQKNLPLVVFGFTTASTLPPANINTVYSTILETDGTTTGPVTFAIISGALPAGLSLNPLTGVIDGNPSEGGDFTIIVSATADGIVCSKTFNLEVIAIVCPEFEQRIGLTNFVGGSNSYYGNVGGLTPRRIFSFRQAPDTRVVAIDADTKAEILVSGPMHVDSGPILYVPTANVVLVAIQNDNEIQVLDAVTLGFLAPIPLTGSSPIAGVSMMAYDSVTDRVYVSWQDNPAVDGGTINSYVGSTLAFSTSVLISGNVDDDADALAYCTGTNKLYVSVYESNIIDQRFQVYQGGTLAFLGTVNAGLDLLDDALVDSLICTEDKVWMQLINDTTGDLTLAVLNSNTDTFQAPAFTSPGGAINWRGLVWAPGANHVWSMLDDGIIRVYDVDDNSEFCTLAANDVSTLGSVADPDTDNVFYPLNPSDMDIYIYP